MNTSNGILPPLTLIGVLVTLSSCCTVPRRIDDYGIPYGARHVQVITPLGGSELDRVLTDAFENNNFLKESEQPTISFMRDIVATNQSYLIRYVIQRADSAFLVRPYWTSDGVHWREAVHAGGPGTDMYEELTVVLSKIPTHSIEYGVPTRYGACW